MADIDVPPYFMCPIVLEIMKDPVTISTGITYDRDSIEKWIYTEKKNTCPVTKKVLFDTELTPNITVRRLIQSWCTLHSSYGVERLPTPKPPVTKPHLLKLLGMAEECPQMQINCLQNLKSIASENQTNKRSMEAVGAHIFIAKLISRKSIDKADDLSEHKKVIDEALSILYSLQLSESGLKPLANAEFIESLTKVMQRGSDHSQLYSIMLLKSILDVADPAELINLRPEFFKELVPILDDQISQTASKATFKILITICPWGRSRIKAVEAGAVHVLILLLDSCDKRMSEMSLMVLDFLCQCAQGRAELVKHGAGLAVVSKKILRISQVASERAVRILHSVSKASATREVLEEMLQIGVVSKLCLVLQVDCGSKTKERAREMLKSNARAWRTSSCIPQNFISSYPS